jgi:spermidine synthase
MSFYSATLGSTAVRSAAAKMLPRDPALAFALGIFFVSGFAALLYQVIWQRLLVIFSGADIYSITIIVGAFMAGLGIGNLAGGHIADRLTVRASLWLFVGAELAVGAFGLLSKAIYYDLLYTKLSFLSGSPAAAVVLFVSLLWPTFFMGVSLPLLARALTRSVSAAGMVVGSLYGWNTLGAAVGALATTWWLLPRLGLADALLVGAMLNAFCAAGAASLAWLTADTAPPSQPAAFESATHAVTAASGPGLSFPVWALVYGVTGFAALALEIAWFRLLGVMLKSSAFTFGTMLAVYLAGLGLGAAIGARLVTRSRQPGVTFLALQVVLLVVTGLSIAALVAMVASGRPAMLAEHFASHEYEVEGAVRAIHEFFTGRTTHREGDDLSKFLILYAALPSALIGGPTILMGLSFPYLQKATQADYSRIGRRVGILMTSNIVGSTLGAILTGLLLLPVLGAAATLGIIVALAMVPGSLLIRQVAATGRARTVPLAVGLVGALALTVAVMPGNAVLWATLHGTRPDRVLTVEDGSGVSVLKADEPGFEGQTWVFVNGLSQSWIPFGNIHTVLGALPLLMHPDPQEIAIIGLGSGDTAFSAAGRPEVRQVVCIEIIGGQRRLLERFAALSSDAGVASLISDPRIEHVVGDGRAYILRADRRFDIIEADALRPSSAYSGNLYSMEYFELLRRHLKPLGLAVTWAPTERVQRTFTKVFPYVLAVNGIYIGSNEPIAFDREAIVRRMSSTYVRAYYTRAGIDIEALIAPYLTGYVATFGPEYDRRTLDDLNSDLFPKDEYKVPWVLPY